MGVASAAITYGLLVASLTSLGSLPAALGRRVSERGLDAGLGFAAGVMIVASFTSLILPALEAGYTVDVGVGIAVGSLFMYALDRVLPHEHLIVGFEGPERLRSKMRRSWLIALAMIIHNIPEGLAIGVATAYDTKLGLSTALAIGVQDIPEGAAVSLPVKYAGRKRATALVLGAVSGLVEALGVLIGAAVFSLARALLGFGMGFGAGAMIYVVVEEIIPEVFREGSPTRREATLAFFIGLYVALYLDVLLG